jgi:hypothetical protein
MWPETVLKALNEYGLLTQLTANLQLANPLKSLVSASKLWPQI